MDVALILLIVGVCPAIVLALGLGNALRRLPNSPQSYLWWEAAPLLFLAIIFAGLGCLNWDYERKLIVPRNDPNLPLVDLWMGPILFVVALVAAVIAAALLFFLRWLKNRLYGPQPRWYFWLLRLVLAGGVSFLMLVASSMIVLGPAAITMFEQMTHVARLNP